MCQKKFNNELVNEEIRKFERVCSTFAVGPLSSSESSSEDSNTKESESEEHADPYKTLKRAKVVAKHVVTPELAAVLDRTKIFVTQKLLAIPKVGREQYVAHSTCEAIHGC